MNWADANDNFVNGDSYSMMKRVANAGAITLSVVNASGRDRLRWSWGL